MVKRMDRAASAQRRLVSCRPLDLRTASNAYQVRSCGRCQTLALPDPQVHRIHISLPRAGRCRGPSTQ